jgi:DNA repair exonuclease SbcCD ATPase subunit
MDYLEDEQYYIDRYDLSTIKECLKIVEMFQDIYDKSLSSNELKDMSKEDKYSDTTKIMYWHLWFIQAQEYKNKNGTIKKWMEEDKLKHDKQDYTPVPEDIKCPLCHDSMYFNTSKHLDDPYDSPIMRMMFLFKCTSCNKQQWVYDDGEIRISEPDLCPKCDKELDVKAGTLSEKLQASRQIQETLEVTIASTEPLYEELETIQEKLKGLKQTTDIMNKFLSVNNAHLTYSTRVELTARKERLTALQDLHATWGSLLIKQQKYKELVEKIRKTSVASESLQTAVRVKKEELEQLREQLAQFSVCTVCGRPL